MKFSWFKYSMLIAFAPFALGAMIAGFIKMNKFLLGWAEVSPESIEVLGPLLVFFQCVLVLGLIVAMITAKDDIKNFFEGL